MTQSKSRSRGRSERREEKAVTRVVSYRRISTNEVNQPHSLEAQERGLSEYIARTPGLVRVGDYFDMETGTKTERPGLQALLAAAADGGFDLVLFYRTDRLSRSVLGFMEVLESLSDSVQVPRRLHTLEEDGAWQRSNPDRRGTRLS